METKEYALITGAGKGLGNAFAIDLAKRNINVLLTALPGEDLKGFCDKLSKTYDIDADYIECDLTKKVEIHKVVDWIKKENYSLNILINNAGFGGTGEFEKVSESLIDNMLLLNVRATTLLTHQLLPILKNSPSAWILNVASIAALLPIGYKTVYPASKAFVAHFSKGLSQELKHTNVFVGVVYPGQMTTQFACMRRIIRHGTLGKMSALSPQITAHKAINRLFKRRRSIFIGIGNKLTLVLTKLVPAKLRLSFATGIFKRELKAT